MSSANNKRLTTCLPNSDPPTFFTSRASPSINKEKSTGDKMHPCLSPTSKENQSVFPCSPNLTQLSTSLYKFLTTLHILPSIPTSNILFHSPSLHTVS